MVMIMKGKYKVKYFAWGNRKRYGINEISIIINGKNGGNIIFPLKTKGVKQLFFVRIIILRKEIKLIAPIIETINQKAIPATKTPGISLGLMPVLYKGPIPKS